jgi:hypothetical protein
MVNDRQTPSVRERLLGRKAGLFSLLKRAKKRLLLTVDFPLLTSRLRPHEIGALDALHMGANKTPSV